jgi:hypothetical protein
MSVAGRLVLDRNRDPALALADRAHDAFAADDINARRLGVQVIDIAPAAALRAPLGRAREGQGGLVHRGYPANQISTTSGGSTGIRSDRTRPGGSIAWISARLSVSNR